MYVTFLLPKFTLRGVKLLTLENPVTFRFSVITRELEGIQTKFPDKSYSC